jgi:hypothetical protein
MIMEMKKGYLVRQLGYNLGHENGRLQEFDNAYDAFIYGKEQAKKYRNVLVQQWAGSNEGQLYCLIEWQDGKVVVQSWHKLGDN